MRNRTVGHIVGSLTISVYCIQSVIGSSASGQGKKEPRDYYPVPDAAVVRSLGEIPAGPCDPTTSQACQGAQATQQDVLKGSYPLDVPGLGIPLGGIGAGSFMINQAGTFGPWTFGGQQNGDRWENRILPQAAFHVREKIGDEAPTIRTLATKGPKRVGNGGAVADRSWGDPLPAWDVLKPGDATYFALYPFGWINYKPFKADVSMRFFSPIVPKNDRLTSLPVAYFDIRLANHTGKNDSISVMFTMPNAPAHTGGKVASLRKGYSNRVDKDSADGITAITMSAEDPANTPDAFKSEWTIAAKSMPGQDVTYATSWNGDGDGSDVYSPFNQSGKLANAPIDISYSAGAIAVSATLKPGEVTTVHFVLTWDFPEITYANNQTVWMRRYTNFYGARENSTNDYIADSYPFHQAHRIATDALVDHDKNLGAVEHWWRPIATDPAYPQVLRTAALNQLYQLAFKMPLWEGGLVSNTVPPTSGQRPGTTAPGSHLFFEPDAVGGNNPSMGMDVGSYAYLAYNFLFPTIERDRLRARAQAIMLDPNGNPGDFNLENPYIKYDLSKAPSTGTEDFLDVPSKTIYRMYAYSVLNHDKAFLAEVYPAMKKQLLFLQGNIRADEHLPRAQVKPAGAQIPALPNTYDVIPVAGRDVYDSELYLLSLEVMIGAGKRTGEEPATIETLKTRLSQAKVEFEATFWEPVNKWYRYSEYTKGTAVLLDTFYAQHVAERLNLPDLVNLEHYQEQLSAHYARFMSGRDSLGRPAGASNMILPEGTTSWPLVTSLFGVLITRQEVDVWTGTNYFVASTYYSAGSRFKKAELRTEGLNMATAVAKQLWEIDENGFVFDPPEAWNHQNVDFYTYPGYERPLSVWDLMDAIKPLSNTFADPVVGD